MKIKKFPISITYGDFKSKSSEFVIPFTGKKQKGFRGLESGRVSRYGAIVFIGMQISTKDVFKKLVDSGQKIDDVDRTLAVIEAFTIKLQEFKIGNIISISYSDSDNSFELIKEANRPPKQNKKKLP